MPGSGIGAEVYVECMLIVCGVCVECVGRSFPSRTAGTRCTLRALVAATDAASAFCWIRSSRSLHYSRYFTPFQYRASRDEHLVPAPGWDPLQNLSRILFTHALCLWWELPVLAVSPSSHHEKDSKDFKHNFLSCPVVLFCRIANALTFMKSMFSSDRGRKKKKKKIEQF